MKSSYLVRTPELVLRTRSTPCERPCEFCAASFIHARRTWSRMRMVEWTSMAISNNTIVLQCDDGPRRHLVVAATFAQVAAALSEFVAARRPKTHEQGLVRRGCLQGCVRKPQDADMENWRTDSSQNHETRFAGAAEGCGGQVPLRIRSCYSKR